VKVTDGRRAVNDFGPAPSPHPRPIFDRSTNMTHDLLTLREVAERTRMAPATVRSWLKDPDPDRRLPSTQIGPQHQYRIRTEDLEAFLARR
jgi:excisionase family DNA binding protein